MPLAQSVRGHLPALRRYARALTGSQESGDAYVAATLEAVVKQPTLVSEDGDPRVDMFRTFTRIWNSVPLNADARDAASFPPERRLAQISALPRQAFLLTSLEMFGEDAAAHVLDTDVGALRGFIDQFGRELADQIATDVLIIEDEALISLDLESLAEGLGHRVVGVARTKNDAIKLAAQKRPGLILADIQLADGSSGLDAVNEMLHRFEVPVIFITAYPERFLTGERPEPAFLIAKPYQPSAVSALISQVLFFEQNASNKKRRATG
jgi:CheY-like chemotaxis protein/DNA-directed RNA polymerase specialized sigma24 family protein